MIDKDFDYSVTVNFDKWTHERIIGSVKASQPFKSEIVRKCVMRCIRQDDAPKWKKFIAKLIRY
jgi:hypothetical protein